jgi:hypothetical protein
MSYVVCRMLYCLLIILSYSIFTATFQVILTTRFAVEDFEEYLFENSWGLPKPKEQYAFIVVDENK